MLQEGGGFFIINRSDTLPTGSFKFMLDYQYQSSFTVDPGANVLITPIPHTQIDREVIMVHSDGTLPGGLDEQKIYRVWNSTDTTMQLVDNDVWPTISIVNITDFGSGTHTLWIRPFESVGTIFSVDISTDFITMSQNHHLRNNNRIRFAVTGGSLPAPLVAGIDYRVNTAPPTVYADNQFRVSAVDLTSAGSGTRTVLSPGYQSSQVFAEYEWGTYGLETAYLLGGSVTLIGGGGGPGEGGQAAGEEVAPKEKIRQILKSPKDVQELIARTRKAIDAVDNFQIVGEGFSKTVDGDHMFNP